MKRIIGIIASIAIAVAATFLYAHIDKRIIIFDHNVSTSHYGQTGVVEETLTQTFQCSEKKLDGVYIKCMVLGDISKVKLHYELIDNATGDMLIEGTLDNDQVMKIKNQKFYTINWKQLQDCKGKIFRFNISEDNADEANGIGFYYEPKIENDTTLSVGNEQIGGTIIMKTVTHRFDLETMLVVLCFVAYIVLFIRVLYKLFK